ncbi:unnamed protein product [Rhizoctonia solani]|uniref:CBM1 domain-containing protein n=1 Tax=Rhizoctonia solani TaxID=456999 RepID=A0A8H3CHK3_9AGAM|nr:unnamed protein product [Rhizoctonia solani]
MKTSGIFVAGSLFQVAAAATGPNWPGFKGLRYFFAFGDSYTTVGFNSWASVPTDANPLGVSYPGATTAGGANWVGFSTVHRTSFTWNTQTVAIVTPLLDLIAGHLSQATRTHWAWVTQELPLLGAQTGLVTSPLSTIKANSGLSTTQCQETKSQVAGAPIAATINTLFSLQETLYTTGARNFLFVNVPPTNRCPFSNNNATLASLVSSWNTQLKAAGEAFQAKHSDIAVFYYDSWSLYTKLLDSPAQYGFTDVTSTGGSFWIDTIHPRTKVHQYMAEDLAKFLASQTGSATNPTTTTTSQVLTTTTRTTSAPASTATGTVPKWEQCGGIGYSGPTTCVAGSTCVVSNQYYSQCL